MVTTHGYIKWYIINVISKDFEKKIYCCGVFLDVAQAFDKAVIKWKKSAGVPQGNVLGPILYLLYTADIKKTNKNTH